MKLSRAYGPSRHMANPAVLFHNKDLPPQAEGLFASFAGTTPRPANSVVPYRHGGRLIAAPTPCPRWFFVGAACRRPPRHVQHHFLCGARRRPRKVRTAQNALAGISRSAPLLVLSRRRRKLRIPHPAASGRLRPLRCSGSPSERRSAFRWVPHSAALGSRGAPDLRAKPRCAPHPPRRRRDRTMDFSLFRPHRP